jgi:hypothetical protein
MSPGAPEQALSDIAKRLREMNVPFALVGGLAVSVRAEVRFTRDLDIAVTIRDDAALETLVRDLGRGGYSIVATVEQEHHGRLAIVRLQSATGIAVDVLAASSGIESEIVARSSMVDFPHVGPVPVASVEDLLAMKVLSASEERLQDRIDARNLILAAPALDLAAVRHALERITARGYDRSQDLLAKLDAILREVTPPPA